MKNPLEYIGSLLTVVGQAMGLIEQARPMLRPDGSYINPHYFPKTWKQMGLPNSRTCFSCGTEFATSKDRYAVPHCDDVKKP